MASTSSSTPLPSTSNSPPVPAWMGRILHESEIEGDFEINWPIIMLEGQSRFCVWALCLDLGVAHQGVPGQSCRMLEKILARFVREHSYLHDDDEAWQAFKRALASRFILLMGTCVRLATKMHSGNIRITSSALRSFLSARGWIYSQQEVCSAEFEVYKGLDFHIPVWTSVDVGLMLSREVGLPRCLLKSVALIVNVSEYNRTKIEKRMQWLNSSTTTGELRTLYLTAGSVVATVRIFDSRVSDPTDKLAALARVHTLYLKSITSVIIAFIKDTSDDEGPTTPKRIKIRN